MVMELDHIKRIFQEASEAVDGSGLPSEFREVAFSKAVDLLSGHTGGTVAAVTHQQSPPPRGISSPPDQRDAIGLIAQRLEVTREDAERVYNVEEDALTLVLSSSKLSSAKKTATQEIALLVAAGRQAAGLDAETTDAERIREVAEHYRKYDAPNFARSIKEMDNVFIVRENGRKKMVKMTKPGWERAGQLLRSSVGAE
jgi:hypothetical protein